MDVGALFGAPPAQSAVPQQSAAVVYKSLEKNRQAYETQFAKQPANKKAVDQFQQFINKLLDQKITAEKLTGHTMDVREGLMNNRQSLQFALEAFGLEDSITHTAVFRKLLTEDPDDSKSLANKFIDTRYAQFAKAFTFLSTNLSDITDGNRKKLVDGLVEKWNTVAFEKWMGEKNPAVREALYFKRTIGKVESIMGMMGDKVLMTVVREALGLPQKFSALDIKQQEAYLKKKINLDELKTENGLKKFLNRFIVRTDMTATREALGGQSAATQLLASATGGRGLINLLV